MRGVESVLPWVLRPLRAEVLRPGQPVSASAYAQDDDPETLHLAAYDDSGAVVGCATFFPEPLDGEPAWRLRGMATASAVRGQGYGGQLLTRGLSELRGRGVPLLWCNARTSAVGFYEGYGFRRRGEEFDVPSLGPHYLLVLRLAAASAPGIRGDNASGAAEAASSAVRRAGRYDAEPCPQREDGDRGRRRAAGAPGVEVGPGVDLTTPHPPDARRRRPGDPEVQV